MEWRVNTSNKSASGGRRHLQRLKDAQTVCIYAGRSVGRVAARKASLVTERGELKNVEPGRMKSTFAEDATVWCDEYVSVEEEADLCADVLLGELVNQVSHPQLG
eukprot:CAMPEP_0195611326 /NCGR_PEP_ID=MMETSP0815-20121206/10282_1 /TAXON_ID=97485 /ORGANISM="Prymnesium parvum, Strain Texoma1" /LENGTH=104 /DNA_ID=CAMNT_0040751373 /DNA_START=373 /DNA_END=688 /DNA_ORIENTATION=+